MQLAAVEEDAVAGFAVVDMNRPQQHLRERGIGTSIHYPVPAHRQPAYHHLGYEEGQFPCAERACREVLSLPLYPELTEDELRYVATAVNTFNG